MRFSSVFFPNTHLSCCISVFHRSSAQSAHMSALLLMGLSFKGWATQQDANPKCRHGRHCRKLYHCTTVLESTPNPSALVFIVFIPQGSILQLLQSCLDIDTWLPIRITTGAHCFHETKQHLSLEVVAEPWPCSQAHSDSSRGTFVNNFVDRSANWHFNTKFFCQQMDCQARLDALCHCQIFVEVLCRLVLASPDALDRCCGHLSQGFSEGVFLFSTSAL